MPAPPRDQITCRTPSDVRAVPIYPDTVRIPEPSNDQLPGAPARIEVAPEATVASNSRPPSSAVAQSSANRLRRGRLGERLSGTSEEEGRMGRNVLSIWRSANSPQVSLPGAEGVHVLLSFRR